MTPSCLLTSARSSLLVIDVQEKLIPVIRQRDAVVNGARFLLDCAALMRVPAVLSEQYPQGLGRTVPPLDDHLAITRRFEKLTFSAAEPFQDLPRSTEPEPGVAASENAGLSESARCQVVVCGIETHVCVLQTALELRSHDYDVFVVADAIGSRHEFDHHLAIDRMRSAGCSIVTAESVAFEWCRTASASQFKSLSRLVKERTASADRTTVSASGD